MDVCTQQKARSKSTFANRLIKCFSIFDENSYQTQGFDWREGAHAHSEEA